ncbi:hypothetical protein GBA52_008602 [Prunus armeniaca]|nr:hypothetical protein GBA52_008602 [Prunus armeniaca]
MSSQLLHFTAPLPITNSITPPPPTPSRARPPISAPQFQAFHTLSQRTHIPSHVYTHPAAILLELCTSIKELNQIIPLIIKNGLYNEHLFQTKLVSLFCNYGSPSEAFRVFETVDDKLEVFYHTLLKGYAKNSSLSDAMSFFCRMKSDGVRPVVYNFTYLLKVCGDNADLRRGKEIHAHLISSGFATNLFAMTAVVNMYAKCRQINEAYKMFDRMPERDLVSWNTIIAGYAQNGLAKIALELVIRMQEEGQKPDSITLVTLLPAVADYGSLIIGKSIHAYVLRASFESLVNISTALLDMYSKCGSVGTARLIFNRMKQKTAVSWNSMIDGYVQNEDAEEAMEIFQKMLDEGFQPTNVTIMEALHACADLGDLERGKFVHKLVDQLKLGSDVSVMNSLMSMYSKCKRVDIAAKIFKNLQGKTLVSWNTMILGYAQNGRVSEALSHFCQMQSQNMKPDSFTMVSVIPALAELSVTRQAKWIHGLVIRTCFDKNIFVMTALVDMYAKYKIFELNPVEGGYHVLLANIYSTASLWDKVAKVRKMMEKKGLQKTPGCSLVDLRNEVHTFYSGSTSHPQSKRIYTFLETLGDEIKAAGYVPDTNSIHDVEADVKEQLLNSHSEKLAIAFGLLNTTPGTTIHIRKNLRVCGDCHNATKYISLVTGREIIVRDMHRFHHFKNGTCSCGDYW